MSKQQKYDDFGRGYYKQDNLYSSEDYDELINSPRNPSYKSSANLIGSLKVGDKPDEMSIDTHLPVIDLDFPCRLVESSPGHFHLYIDREINTEQYSNLLNAFAAAGLVEFGFLNSFKKHKQTFVRPSWIKKIPKEKL